MANAMIMGLVSVLTTSSMADISHVKGPVLINRPAYAYVNSNYMSSINSMKSREELEQNYVSYSVSQRTPGRASKY
jgi:hypothetical protein